MSISIESFHHCGWNPYLHLDSRCYFLNSKNNYCVKYNQNLKEDDGTDMMTGRDTFAVLRCTECKQEYPRG